MHMGHFFFSKITFQIHALDEYDEYDTRNRKSFAVVSLVLVTQAASWTKRRCVAARLHGIIF